ncbi:MAG TPA: hypothetical protein PKN48_12920 [Bacteroidales bacterium]|nr:hypothetical protein [Bacteroidales bacterium]
MKIKIFLLFLIAFLCNSCTTKIVEETIESYPDGTPRIVRFYKDDGKNRVLFKETLYYSNRQKYMEGEYKNGKRNGKWTSWYQNGNKWSEGSYIEGVDDGKRVGYHENGKKYFEGNYKEGKKIGTWKFWDEQGVRQDDQNFNK